MGSYILQFKHFILYITFYNVLQCLPVGPYIFTGHFLHQLSMGPYILQFLHFILYITFFNVLQFLLMGL